MQTNEELAALFSRNLTFQSRHLPAPEPEPEPIIYSISQHYTHSAHVVRQPEPIQEQPPRPSSEPPQTQEPSAEFILSSYGVDQTALSASQMELFKSAEHSQKLRLIELWRICPPANSHENPAVAWQTTTVEQEEMLAQLRYERQLAEDEQKRTVMSLDGTPLTPVQSTDGQWMSTSYMEPYMLSGYEALARREYEESAREQYIDAAFKPKDIYSHLGSAVGAQPYRPATDPVYNNNDWARQQQTMENLYGAYQMDHEMEL